ncbi:MAG: HAD family hydrolase [Puniceicoccales bacterium]|nr:HAD family hydrolase [Puniceicoccales bacterium]
MKFPLLQNIRVVSFDLVGTLVVPSPSPGHVYARCLRKHAGALADKVSPAALDAHFPDVYKKQLRAAGGAPRECAVRAFWEGVMRDLLGEACPASLFPVVFEDVFAAFARGENWKVCPGVWQTLQALHFLGYRVAALSNADSRMRTALEELRLAPYFEKILTSAELGVSKPDAKAFHALASAMGVAAVDVLHVGDSLREDVDGAREAGMRGAWLAPDAHFRPVGSAIVLNRLEELPDALRRADTAHLQNKPLERETRNLVALLRGLPEEAPWGPRRRHEEPARAVGAAIFAVAGKLRTEARPLEIVRDHWLEVVGKPLLAEASEPRKISPTGLLSVWCSGATVREELQRWHAGKVLEAVRKFPACENIQKVRFYL